MRALALLVMIHLGACWTSQPPPPLTPAPTTPTTIAQRAPKPTVVPRRPGEVAQALAKQLRAKGPQLLTAMLLGPVVALDLDSQQVATLCGRPAERAAQEWGELLIDTTRADPMCIAGTEHTFTCVQVSPPDVLIIELEEPTRWRIRSVTLGNHTGLSANLEPLRNAVSTASCP